MADDPYESAGCLFIILFVIVVVIVFSYLVYHDTTNPRFSQLVCQIDGKITTRSKTFRASWIHKNTESSDWTVGNETYTPRPGESCRKLEVKVK